MDIVESNFDNVGELMEKYFDAESFEQLLEKGQSLGQK